MQRVLVADDGQAKHVETARRIDFVPAVIELQRPFIVSAEHAAKLDLDIGIVDILLPRFQKVLRIGRIQQTAGAFRSRVTIQSVTAGGAPVEARSMISLVGAGIRQGDTIRLAAEGEDEAVAVAALRALIEANVAKHEIDLFRGVASFEDPRSVRVTAPGRPDRVSIASGATTPRSAPQRPRSRRRFLLWPCFRKKSCAHEA